MVVPVPKQMRALARDKRGYPIPFTVQRDMDGKPCFTVTDIRKTLRCITEKRCAICGSRMGKPFWFVGGPLSAFHQKGAYLDAPLHYDCMTYALRVCPYLAVRTFAGRLDLATVNVERLGATALIDETMIPDRPSLFVGVATTSFTWVNAPHPRMKPERPYVAVEYWQHGEQLTDEQALPLVEMALHSFDRRSARDAAAIRILA